MRRPDFSPAGEPDGHHCTECGADTAECGGCYCHVCGARPCKCEPDTDDADAPGDGVCVHGVGFDVVCVACCSEDFDGAE